MTAEKTILLVGTYDTKDDELTFVADAIREQGGWVLTMDVSVLGDPAKPCDFSKHDVTAEAGSSIREAIESGSENEAMQIMARGASELAARLYGESRFDGVLVLGGSMGTDLALDVCSVLPLGIPKYIVSTVSFSPMIPPERLPADIQMILWAGGLYGLNSICEASLSQAAGAVLGAARSAKKPDGRPLIGMTGLGTSFLKYMIPLKPALEERGFEVAVFHATGMGGRAFESLAAQGAFACVFDLCTQELGNHVNGSALSAGPSRLTSAGLAGVPQIVAPGCYDLVDIVGWHPFPEKWASRGSHAHNRLLTSVVLDADERREVARAHNERLAKAKGPTAFILPLKGCHELEREGSDLHDAAGLAAFCHEFQKTCPGNVDLHVLEANINDAIFAGTALGVLDRWIDEGHVKPAISLGG